MESIDLALEQESVTMCTQLSPWCWKGHNRESILVLLRLILQLGGKKWLAWSAIPIPSLTHFRSVAGRRRALLIASDIFEITDDELRIFSFTLCVDFAQKCARNPSLPWLQIQLVFPFGVAWCSPSAPTPRYIVACLIQRVLAEPHWFHKPFTRNDQRVVYDGCSSGHRPSEKMIKLHIWRCLPQVIGTCAGIGCPSAVYAWLQLCCKGPMHQDYICPMEAKRRRATCIWMCPMSILAMFSRKRVLGFGTWDIL